jgi:hypothetical protein
MNKINNGKVVFRTSLRGREIAEMMIKTENSFVYYFDCVIKIFMCMGRIPKELAFYETLPNRNEIDEDALMEYDGCQYNNIRSQII